MKQHFIKLEVDKNLGFEELSKKIEEIKESRQSLTDLYESQIEMLKGKLDSNLTDKDKDLVIQLS